MATPDQILEVRYMVGDSDPSLPVMSDTEINYFIDRNESSIGRASVEVARSLMFKLSMRTDQTVDIISIKGSKAATNWIAALKLFISSPSLNPLYNNLSGWAGGVSLSEMRVNNNTIDNNINSLAINEKYPRDVDDTVGSTTF